MENNIRQVDTGILGFYGEYKGRSIGRLIHFLYDVYGMHRADSFTLGDWKVTWGSESVATYHWINDTDVPVFSFCAKYKHVESKQEEQLKLLLGEYTNAH